MSDYINENLLGASPYKSQAAESKKLVSKWEKTGLLDGLNEDFKKSGMAVMLENQAKQLISEASATGGRASGATAGAGSEEWSGVALPLVRRIFGEIAAQEFVSVQPMNLPSGLVFYLDFKYGTARNAFSATAPNNSVFGQTGKNTPQDAPGPYGEQGPYGEGRYGYTVASSSQSYTANTSSAEAFNTYTGSADEHANRNYFTSSISVAEDLLHDSITSASFVAEDDISDPTKGYFVIGFLTASFDRPDLLSVRSWQLSGSGTAGGTMKVYPQFTKVNGNAVEFVVSSSAAVGTGDVWVEYQEQPTDSTRGDFEDTQGDATNDFLAIPEVDLQLNSLPIVAKTRKLKAVWKPLIDQYLHDTHIV
jgi:hypothetical protein